jgi:2-methylcitrate dehydratase PrpD
LKMCISASGMPQIRRRPLGGQRIERLDLGVNASPRRLCTPLEQRLRPATLADAKYSAPFVTAATLVHDEPSPDLMPAVD